MREIDIALTTKNGDNKLSIGSFSMSTETILFAVVDNTPTRELLMLIKTRLLHNASGAFGNEAGRKYHEKELKEYLNTLKD
jgi:hypothetical protein